MFSSIFPFQLVSVIAGALVCLSHLPFNGYAISKFKINDPFAVVDLSYARAKRSPIAAPPQRDSDVTVSLTGEQSSAFLSAIEAVADQGKVCIIAEGVPLLSKHNADEAPLLSGRLEVHEALAAIAKRYDYALLESAKGLFLLQKRYTNPLDFPCVTLEEWVDALGDLARLSRPFLPDPPLSDSRAFVKRFAAGLTAEQMQSLKDGNLPVASLSPALKSDIYRMTIDTVVAERYNRYANALAELEIARQIDLGFQNLDGLPTLNYGFTGGAESGAAYRRLFQGGIAFKSQDDGSDIDLDKLTKGKNDLSTWKPELSVGVILRRLQKRAPAGEEWLVDAALKGKIVAVAGEGNAAPEAVFRALTLVYGLRIVTEAGEKDGRRLRITRFRVAAPNGLAALPQSRVAALPDPIRRYLQFSMTEKEQTERDIPAFFSRMNARAEEISRAAAKTLKQMTLARIAAQDKKGADAKNLRIPLKGMSMGERAIFALALQYNVLKGFSSLYGAQLPPVVAHWEESTLSGGPFVRNGRRLFNLFIDYRVPNDKGGYDGNGGGMGDVPYELEPSGP